MNLNFRRMASFSCFTAFLFFAASNAFAHVGSGGNCAGCHSPDTNRMTVTGNTGTLTLNPRLDFGTTTALPLYTVTQGSSVPLTINVTNGGSSGDEYAVALTGTMKSSVVESLTTSTIKGVKTATSDLLGLITDPNWISKTPTGGSTHADSLGKTYFEQPLTWADATVSKTYNLGVSLATLPDVYTLTLRAAGVDGGGEWTQSQEILVQVLPQSVPEPSTIFLMLSAAVFGFVTWRKKR